MNPPNSIDPRELELVHRFNVRTATERGNYSPSSKSRRRHDRPEVWLEPVWTIDDDDLLNWLVDREDSIPIWRASYFADPFDSQGLLDSDFTLVPHDALCRDDDAYTAGDDPDDGIVIDITDPVTAVEFRLVFSDQVRSCDVVIRGDVWEPARRGFPDRR